MPDAIEPRTAAHVRALEEEIARLNKVVQALMRRAESATNIGGSDFGLFQTTVMLEEQVRRRTEELETALQENERIARELRVASAATEVERRRLALILENTDDGVALLDLDNRISYANPGIVHMIEALGTASVPESLADLEKMLEVRHADDSPLPSEELPISEAFAGKAVGDLELHLRHKASGEQMTALLSALPVRDAEGAVMQVVVTMRDISERRRSEELLQETLEQLERSRQELLDLASHDSLTGLLNRRRFEEEFERQLLEQQRLGRGGALIWLDLDHFKDVNDTLGHRVGDELLMLVAQTLRTITRRYSVIARLGGDEFAIVIPAADEAEAMGAANRLIEVLAARELDVAGHAIRIGASVGVVLYPDHGSTVRELLSAADVAMYHAKETGRGRATLYDPHELWASESEARSVWGERIRTALAEDRLILHAQPIRRLTDAPLNEYELLVRMIGDDGELIAPLEFIPAAERLALVGEIDAWVVRQAIQLLAAEQAAGQDTRLCINLSGRTLSDELILDVFREELASTGADPRRLTVEITETAVVSNISAAAAIVHELHRLGCRFSMDDFGTGASSFFYLRHLPIDVLKIDGSLIKDLGAEPADEQFVRAVVQMCQALQITCVAEYVETDAVLGEVERAGVDCAQGFLLGRPQPLSTYLKSQGASA